MAISCPEAVEIARSEWLTLPSLCRTSFANYLDPNQGVVLPNATYWPTYGSDSERNMLRLLEGNVTVFPDTYREQMEYFLTEPEAFNQRKRSL